MTEKQHWLTRPETIRKLWIAGWAVLALTVLAQAAIGIYGKFPFEAWFGFNAVYGFLTCAAMVLFAKVLGGMIKRRDTYYDD
jgi:hypothetical protein